MPCGEYYQSDLTPLKPIIIARLTGLTQTVAISIQILIKYTHYTANFFLHFVP